MGYDGSIRIDTSLDGDGFTSGLKKMSSLASAGLKGLVTGIAAVGTALGAGALAGVQYNAKMEQYITSFGTMLGSAEQAQGLMADLKKFAAETPFEMTDLAKGSQTLLAFGLSAEKLMPTLKTLGDVSQGNKERFDGLTLAFAQVSSAGKLTGQDLLQMVNAGFNPLNEISKTTGKSIAELKDEMAKGAISADMVAEAFEHATSEGGQFYNAMQSQSQTFSGQLSTLKDNAISFIGELTEGFTNKLKDTALPMVNDWLAQLQAAFSAGGPQALTRAFGDVLASALSVIAQQAPAVIESASEIVQSFIRGIKKNLPALADSAAEIVSSLVKGIADIFPREIAKPIGEAMDAIEKSIKSGGLRSGIETFKKMLDGLSRAVASLTKTVLPIFVKILDTLGDNMKLIAPATIAAVAAIKTWKIAQQAKLWVDVASKALTAYTAASTASATASTAAAASVSLGQFAYGILSGKIALATAAQTIFNAVLNANPIGLAITAVAGLVAGVTVLASALDNSKEQAERLNTAFNSMADGATNFYTGLQTATSHLDAFNTELFASSEEQAQLQANMQEVQSGITAICRNATTERRGYTQAEVVQLQEYFTQLDALNAQQLAIETARMDAVKQQALMAAEQHSGSLAEYQVTAQEWIATATQQKDAEVALIQEQCTQKLILLGQQQASENALSQTAYEEACLAATKERDAKIQAANEEVGAVTAAYTNGFLERSSLIQSLNSQIDTENKRHSDYTLAVQKDYIGATAENNDLLADDVIKHNENIATIWDNLTQSMSEEEKEQLGTYIAMAGNTEMYGGKMSISADAAAKNIVGSFESMPPGTLQAMKDAMSPMLDEMERGGQALFAKARSIANGVIATLKSAFQERSPSRATQKIFRYLMDGGMLGLEDGEPSLLNKSTDIGNEFIARMQSAVESNQRAFGVRFSAQTDYETAQRKTASEAIAAAAVSKQAAPQHATVTTPVVVEINGREILKCTKEAEATFGYNVGGMQHAW